MHRIAIVCLAILIGSAGAAQQTPPPASTPRVMPGELIVDPPTLINLGFEWLIDGDTNRNAKVDVSYRKVGDGTWSAGLPLLRLQHERVTQPNVFTLVLPNMFAGSIFDLEPDTAYEARFVLTDPDGVDGPGGVRPEPSPFARVPNRSQLQVARSITSIRSATPDHAPNRRSPASCAPTTTIAALATPRRAEGRA